MSREGGGWGTSATITILAMRKDRSHPSRCNTPVTEDSHIGGRPSSSWHGVHRRPAVLSQSDGLFQLVTQRWGRLLKQRRIKRPQAPAPVSADLTCRVTRREYIRFNHRSRGGYPALVMSSLQPHMEKYVKFIS